MINNKPLALHTAARRYCQERRNILEQRFSKLESDGKVRKKDKYDHYSDTPEAQTITPRISLLYDILIELERLDPATLHDLEKTRTLLILAGSIVNTEAASWKGEIRRQAFTEEWVAYHDYIQGLTPTDLSVVEPLPYRRLLTLAESKLLWLRMRQCWQISEHNWFPLSDCTLADVIAFDSNAFDEIFLFQRTQDILTKRGIKNVWELRESGTEHGFEYELDISLLEPCYTGREGYWFSDDLKWIIYASHEGSITVGGWLTQEIKRVWPDWEAHLWKRS